MKPPTLRRRAVQHEKTEQAQVAKAILSLGGRVWVTGTRRARGRNCPNCGVFVEEYQGTRMTPGLADLLFFIPAPQPDGSRRKRFAVMECKAGKGRLTPEQRDFLACCLEAEVPHIQGGIDAFYQWLVAEGIVRSENVAHYRLQGGAAHG